MKIIDMHCDTIYEILEGRKRGRKLSLRRNNLMLDLERMKQGEYSVQNFALFVEQKQGKSSFKAFMELLAVFNAELEENADLISRAVTAEDILQNEKRGRMSALLTVEGGEVCEGKPENLQYLYDQGVRMMTLTWNFSNEIGHPNFDDSKDFFTPNTVEGLTETGIYFVEEMERMGMIVDVSHLSDAGFYDVLKYTKKPFVASHSNARAVCPWVRNLTDDMLRKLAARGGVVGLNYCADFLRAPSIAIESGSIDGNSLNEWKKKIKNGRQAAEGGYATLDDIVKHARHIADVGGVECIGLGSDFDGIPSYPECPKAEQLDELAAAFAKGGFHQWEIDKIFYQNVFRLYKDILG